MSQSDLHSEAAEDATAGAASVSEENEADSSAADSKGKPSGGGRLTRLAGESRALFDDLREWVDLRVKLVQVEIEERIEKAVNEAIALIMVAVVGLFAVAFLLHGIAIWIGDALGGSQWGYLIMAAVLGLVTLVLKTAKPDFVGSRKTTSDKQLNASASESLRLQEGSETAKPEDDRKEAEGHG